MRNRIKKIVNIFEPKWYMNYYIRDNNKIISYTLSLEKTNLYEKYKNYLIRYYEK